MNNFFCINIPKSSLETKSSGTGVDVESIKSQSSKSGYFFLETCQRILITGLSDEPSSNVIEQFNTLDSVEFYRDSGAYRYLLETICGLKSRLLGETEIVSQFKEGFEQYLQIENRSTMLIKIFHKIFSDSKKIRHEYLRQIGLLSYCGLTKALLKNANHENNQIALLGSGKLAQDFLKVLSKNYTISLYARNPQKLEDLAGLFPSVQIVQADSFDGTVIKENTVINTIPFGETLFDQSFLTNSGQCDCPTKTFVVDLSAPSSICQTAKSTFTNVYDLNDLFNLSKQLEKTQHQKIHSALEIISKMASERLVYFKEQKPKLFQNVQREFALV
ncbi:MAG: hypothetical protein ACPGJV_06590 [Bacteriovoracaceae bacterium]